MVIKGRIHGELGIFERYSWNSVKSDDELRLEIGKFDILKRQLKIESTESKIKWFGGEFEEKSRI